MTVRFWICAAIAVVGLVYLAVQFGRLVLDDAMVQREAGEDAARDADTVEWLHALADTEPADGAR